MNKDKRSIHEKLSDENVSFIKKLKIAIGEGELDYWWERGNPPNESSDIFRKFVKKLNFSFEPKWVERESEAGPHGLLGEDRCFKFESEISLLGLRKKYFVKGYFFNKGDLKGVTIQSFREIPIFKVVKKEIEND